MRVLLILLFLSGCTTFSSTSDKSTPNAETPIIVTMIEEDIDSYEEVEEDSTLEMGKILEGFMPSYLLF